MSDDVPSRPKHRFRGQDAITEQQRSEPAHQSGVLSRLERESTRHQPGQLPLFEHIPAYAGDATEPIDLPPLSSSSPVTVARNWYRHHLEHTHRSHNTIVSYSYDLLVLENLLGPKPLKTITNADIARYLGDAGSRTTRKRRLTSARRFFRYLIDDCKVLTWDPTEGYYPHQIAQKDPRPLFATEQTSLLAAAEQDEPWSAIAISLMLHIGLSRSELLTLERDHIDRSNPGAPIIHVYYEDATKQDKERAMLGDAAFSARLDAFLEQRDPAGVLFPVGPQAVNGMVDRVRKAAGITREITPQTLRHTFAIEAARKGADVPALLRMLGLIDDPRNRKTAATYIRLAAPPANASPEKFDASPEIPT